MQWDYTCSLSLAIAVLATCSLIELVLPLPMPIPSTSRPRLVVSSIDEPLPMTYQFIVDHRPTSLGQNYYIKPGQLVGTFTLDSGMLHVNHEDSKRTVSSKLNILFIADAKAAETPAKAKLGEDATLP